MLCSSVTKKSLSHTPRSRNRTVLDIPQLSYNMYDEEDGNDDDDDDE